MTNEFIEDYVARARWQARPLWQKVLISIGWTFFLGIVALSLGGI